jgi:hypothetical protein
MNDEEQRLENQAADELLINALKVEVVDLEPTESEIELFLAEENNAFPVQEANSIEDVAKVEERLSVIEAEAEYSALNRKNAENRFSHEIEEKLSKKRAELFEKMIRRHAQSEQ